MFDLFYLVREMKTNSGKFIGYDAISNIKYGLQAGETHREVLRSVRHEISKARGCFLDIDDAFTLDPSDIVDVDCMEFYSKLVPIVLAMPDHKQDVELLIQENKRLKALNEELTERLSQARVILNDIPL